MGIDVHVIKASWSEHAQMLQQIREKVFIEEQEVPRDLEWDGLDEDSTHFLAVNSVGQYVGCARLLTSGQIGRMAVIKEYRGRNVGAALLTAAVDEGQDLGMPRLFLHAQSYAEDFYRKGGFLPIGTEFMEADIPHIEMEMILPVKFDPPAGLTNSAPKIRRESVRPTLANNTDEFMTFDGLSQTSAALEHVIRSARRRVYILNPYLDHELFDTTSLSSVLSELARSAAKVEIQILIFNSQLIVERGHRILDLARRLDEKIKIRLLAEKPTSSSSSFVCADLDAYWLLPNYETYNGIADLSNPVTCKRLTETFETAWGKSREDNELRILRL